VSAAPRQRLPNRRDSETFSFSWLVMSFTASISRYSDGKLAEIFLASPKVGTHADIAGRDGAVVASRALQHGVLVETLRRALLRDSQGIASGPLGVALDIVDGRAKCPAIPKRLVNR
jgi:hypothetical protein